MALLFDELYLGQTWGEYSWEVAPALCVAWYEAMGEPPLPEIEGLAPPMPAGLLVVMFSNYMDAMVPPRPPGMLYAGQKFSYGAPARYGDVLTTTLSVLDKYHKRNRSFVEFASHTVNQRGELVANGVRTVVWGA